MVRKLRRRGRRAFQSSGFVPMLERLESRLLLSSTQLVYTPQPAETTAGSPFNVVIGLEDPSNVVEADDNSVVTLSVAEESQPGTLRGTLTAQANNGIATFSGLSINVAGAYVLAAGDTADDLSDERSDPFDVDAIPNPIQLGFGSLPVSESAGTLGPIQVAVEDTYGNTIPSDNSQITLTLASGPSGSTLGGTITANVQNGIATFNSLLLTKTGTYTFAASDTGDSVSGSSTTLVITPDAAHQLAFTPEPSNATAGTLPDLFVSVEDTYGNVVTTDDSTMLLTLGKGPGSLGGVTSVMVNNGIATFADVTLSTIGTYTLQAGNGIELTTTSSSFTIAYGSASKLIFSQVPATASAGQSMTARVEVEDSAGNLIASDNSIVTMTLATGASGTTLGGVVTATVVNGVAVFKNLILTKADTYEFAASDGSLSGATSSKFTITPAAAKQLIFLPIPSTSTAGQNFTVEVDVEDAYGNLMNASYSGTVNLWLDEHPTNGTFGFESAPVLSGVATFKNVSLTIAGTYTLMAGSPGLTAIQSAPFKISPAAASKFIYTTPPSNSAAGTLDPIVVTVEDSYGNVETGYHNIVTMVLYTKPADTTLGGTYRVAATNGVATFSNLVLMTPGTYRLEAEQGNLSITSGPITILPAVPTKLVFIEEPINTTAGIAEMLKVAVENTFSNIVKTNTSIVTLTLGITQPSGGATIGGTVTARAINGIATFTDVILTKAGTYTLDAGDGKLSAAASTRFGVQAGAVSQLVFLSAPTSGHAGQPLGTIVIAAEDKYGNISIDWPFIGSSSPGDVILAPPTESSMPIGLLITKVGPGGTLQEFDTVLGNGVVTFANIALDQAGTYTMVGLDPDPHNGIYIPGEQYPEGFSTALRNLVIYPEAASKLGFIAAPQNTTAGAMWAPVEVAFEDSYGNVVTSDDSQITLQLTPMNTPNGNGVISSLTAIAINGIATFSGLSVTGAGQWDIYSSEEVQEPGGEDGELYVPAVEITVLPAVPSQLVFSQQPQDTPSGGNLLPIIVSIEDQYGNVETADDSTVRLAANVTGSLRGSTADTALNGVATFSNLYIIPSGTYTLAASDGADNLIGFISNPFVIDNSPGFELRTLGIFNANNGDLQSYGVITDSSGNVYGETYMGNNGNGDGAIFEIMNGSSSIVTLATFNGVNGLGPNSELSIDSSGNLYGTTEWGGVGWTTGSTGDGTVFELPKGSHSIVTIANFNNNVEWESQGSLVIDSNGNVYGAANGVAPNDGACFYEIIKGSSSLTVLSEFNGRMSWGLLMDSTGDLFGYGYMSDSFSNTGNNEFVASVLELPCLGGGKYASTPVAIASFNASIGIDAWDNYGLVGNLAIDSQGNIYCTAETAQYDQANPGYNQTVAVYKINVKSSSLGTLVTFSGHFVEDTENWGGLAVDTNGNVFVVSSGQNGIAVFGASSVSIQEGLEPADQWSDGTIFEIPKDSGRAVALPSPQYPDTVLSIDSNGNLFGTITTGGPSGYGLVYELERAQLAFTPQPPSGSAGTLGPIVVSVEDPEGNVLLNDSSTITLAVATGPGRIGGAVTATAVNGVATFGGATLLSPGTYTLEAIDGFLLGATSLKFVIS